MNLLILFIIGIVLSAGGALPVGLINLSVAKRTINRGAKSGLMVALGASIIELLYTFIAVYFVDFLVRNEIISQFIQIAAFCIFLCLGIYYMLKKTKEVEQPIRKSKARDFVLGIGISSMNMLIIPYWMFLSFWLKSNGFEFSGFNSILILSLGSTLGAFLVFILYIKLGSLIVNKLHMVTVYSNKFLGILFFGLAIFQVIRYWYYS
jgi:threonine/homoserine/homoserine lactone efflux protein